MAFFTPGENEPVVPPAPTGSNQAEGGAPGPHKHPSPHRRRFRRWRSKRPRPVARALPIPSSSGAEEKQLDHPAAAPAETVSTLKTPVDLSPSQPLESGPQEIAKPPSQPMASPYRKRMPLQHRYHRPAKPVSALSPVGLPAENLSGVQKSENQSKTETARPDHAAETISSPSAQLLNRTGKGLRNLRFPGLDCIQARNLLLQFIPEQLEILGTETVVLSLSGGLDSCLTAHLLVAAVGNSKVHLIHFLESDRGSVDRALAEFMAKQLQCHLEIKDLRPQMKYIWNGHPDLKMKLYRDRLARERMAALYTWAETKAATVVGSLNKTKILLGWGTNFGDLAFSFNLLADLYRSQVWELAKALALPKIILEKASQRELSSWLIEDKQVSFTDKELDFYLYQIVDQRYSLTHLLNLGAEAAKLQWVYRRLREAKRQQRIPPLPEVTSAYLPRAGEMF